MKIVIAPDSFKESLSAFEVASAIERGFQKVFPDIQTIKIPMADGGEGTVDTLVKGTGGKFIKKEVTGPTGTRVEAKFGILGDGHTAVIEMAAASGIHLVPQEKRNPLWLTTRGTGELILAALDEGVKKIIIGLGGSATNDGGAGMAKALGVKLLDKHGNDIPDGGGYLTKIASIDISALDPRLNEVTIEAACDVNVPLLGKNGASAIFFFNDAATTEMIEELDKNLAHYARKIKEYLGRDVADVPGAGAAGGLGAGLLAFLDAKLRNGIEIVLEVTKFREIVQDADFVITGEGKIDGQTIYGKTPIGVAKVAKEYDIPVIGIAGTLTRDSRIVYDYGIDALFSIVPGIIPESESMENAAEYIENLAANIAALLKISRQIIVRRSVMNKNPQYKFL